jgi:hypothetical protein
MRFDLDPAPAGGKSGPEVWRQHPELPRPCQGVPQLFGVASNVPETGVGTLSTDVVDVDCVDAERGHTDSLVGEEEERWSGNPVGQGLTGVCEQVLRGPVACCGPRTLKAVRCVTSNRGSRARARRRSAERVLL